MPPSDLNGYHGAYLRVDVSTGQAERVPLPEKVLRAFLGGVGLGAWIVLQEGAAKADPLSTEAPLAFVFSPLVGSPLTTSAKFAVVGKSPLTQRFNDSLASSQFALAGKRCGVDALVLVGQAESPSILLIDEDEIRLEPAEDLWGETIPTAEKRLRKVWGLAYQFAVIGPAGERQVRFATISHDGRHAGRGGHGAVLGSKRLKAVAVRGAQRCTWAYPQELAQFAKELSAKSWGPATAKYRELGTMANLLVFNRLQALPTRNFQRSQFAEAVELSPEHLSATRQKTRDSCAACTIGCEHIYALKEDDSPGVRLEYENVFALGPLCGVSDPQTVLECSRICDELGLDTISAGGTIAFAMECAERGWLDIPWLRFGNAEALPRALQSMVTNDELGQLLRQGSRRMAGMIGHDSIDFAPQVKGLEIPGYEPRALQSMALGFAVGSRGADHNRSGAYEADFSEKVDRLNLRPEDVSHAVESENRAAILDSLILCKFLRGTLSDFYAESAEMLRLVTGWEIGPAELQETARRIVNVKKRFNMDAGWETGEDSLPARFFEDQLPGVAHSSFTPDRFRELVQAYYAERGWRKDGRLTEDQALAISMAESCNP